MNGGLVRLFAVADMEHEELGGGYLNGLLAVHGLLVGDHVTVKFTDVPEAAQGDVAAPGALVAKEDNVLPGGQEGDVVLDAVHENGSQCVGVDVLGGKAGAGLDCPVEGT